MLLILNNFHSFEPDRCIRRVIVYLVFSWPWFSLLTKRLPDFLYLLLFEQSHLFRPLLLFELLDEADYLVVGSGGEVASFFNHSLALMGCCLRLRSHVLFYIETYLVGVFPGHSSRWTASIFTGTSITLSLSLKPANAGLRAINTVTGRVFIPRVSWTLILIIAASLPPAISSLHLIVHVFSLLLLKLFLEVVLDFFTERFEVDIAALAADDWGDVTPVVVLDFGTILLDMTHQFFGYELHLAL